MIAIELFMFPCQKSGMEQNDKIAFIKGNLNKSILLVGLMGAGKSSIGRKLAKLMDLEFVDSDHVVEGGQRLTIAQIFEHYGESRFRTLEREAIITLTEEDEVKIIGTGGGAFMNDDTRAAILKSGLSIFLKADLDVLSKRVGDGFGRPLFKDKNPRDVLTDLIKVRYPVYSQANLTVETRAEPAEETLNRVIDSIYRVLIND